jgi:hypothetical protein
VSNFALFVAELKEKEVQTPAAEKQVRTLQTINCHDCGAAAELAGYAFRLFPICSPCRSDEDVRVLHKRIDRRARGK